MIDVAEKKNERLTTKQVSEEFNINSSTLRGWRRARSYDKRYPRFHKLFTGKIYYIRSEFQEDLELMEIDIDAGGMVF